MTPEALEVTADIQHAIWAYWMRHLFSVCDHHVDGSCTIPAEKVTRWDRQMRTGYGDLSEKERESDREIVRRFLM